VRASGARHLDGGADCKDVTAFITDYLEGRQSFSGADAFRVASRHVPRLSRLSSTDAGHHRRDRQPAGRIDSAPDEPEAPRPLSILETVTAGRAVVRSRALLPSVCRVLDRRSVAHLGCFERGSTSALGTDPWPDGRNAKNAGGVRGACRLGGHKRRRLDLMNLARPAHVRPVMALQQKPDGCQRLQHDAGRLGINVPQPRRPGDR